MKIGNREFDVVNNNYIMGILNVTPDSFSDGGRWSNIDLALKHAEDMIKDGAAIIDIGGESTRPGYIRVTEEEEINRIIPYIEKVKELGVPVSVDTYKARVAEEAVRAGAALINDIWGFKGDENMAGIAAKYQVPCCIMHNRNIQEKPYKNLMEDVLNDLRESIDIGLRAGIRLENLITDPGIGFGKTLDDNLTVMKHLERLHELKCPILLGASRKSMIGLTLDLPIEERVEGTIAATVIGILKDCAFIRVHDVRENFRALKMTQAVKAAG